MIFRGIKLKGAYIIELDSVKDERGFFARAFCEKEFKQHGLDFRTVQCGVSYNKKKGTLRGMHYQLAPYQQAKLIRCMKGAIYDVIIDLRPDSATYHQWFAVELNDENFNAFYIPGGFAHGFQALADDTTIFYQMSEFYHPESERGVMWNDPLFDIKWPIEKVIVSHKDQSHKIFKS